MPTILKPENTINIGLLGDVSIVSISYERLFCVRPDHFLTIKAGLGFNQAPIWRILPQLHPSDNVVRNFLTIPHHFTSNYGRGKHFGEIGLGGTLLTGNTGPFYTIYPIVGYRYMPLEMDAICFRIFAMYPFSLNQNAGVWGFPIGLSLGGTF
ncbi:MAG: hypothetical protein K9I85_04605 [Saprospiraceae bacterium]|nr:hypothetical protein [Saprospiraceae bacterium]